MSETSNDSYLDLIIHRIKAGRCTPFLGAGASAGVLPLGGEIARRWAEEFGYPLEDSSNLAGVSQFVALQNDAMFPKEKLAEELIAGGRLPDYGQADEPHRVLASLPLPVYITTNYDDFMFRALKLRSDKEPHRELCRWNRMLAHYESAFDGGYVPTAATPLVYHLHGYSHTDDGYRKTLAPESMVLTEDDYLDFTNNLASDPNLIPPHVQRALAGTSLLFVGYRLADTNFRVLLRGISRYMERGQVRHHLAVMLPPDGPEVLRNKAQAYLERYFGNIDVRIVWATASEFARALRAKWEEAERRA